MEMQTASETVNQSTSQYFYTSLKKTTGYFLLAGTYALVTSGPIILTASVCAISTIFDRIVSCMLRDLVKKDIISLRTFCILHNTINILSCTALIITGIYLNILGPVAIAFIALNILNSLSDFNKALKARQPPIQINPQPVQHGQAQLPQNPLYIPPTNPIHFTQQPLYNSHTQVQSPPPPYTPPTQIPAASAPPLDSINQRNPLQQRF